MTKEKIWNKVMKLKNKETRTKGIINTLNDDEIETILATADFFGASTGELALISFDLRTARYRLFDLLGMLISGRITTKPVVQVLVYSYLKAKGNIDHFIADLRETDYDIDESWKKIII